MDALVRQSDRERFIASNRPALAARDANANTSEPKGSAGKKRKATDAPDDAPSAKKKTPQKSDGNSSSTTGKVANKPKAGAAKKCKQDPYDVSMVSLPDLELQPVYETPESLRPKIAAFLRRDGVTQAGFLRAIAPYAYPEPRETIPAVTFKAFMNKGKMSRSGAKSPVFYPAYCFLEKVRLRENKPKSDFREEMEDQWGCEGGLDWWSFDDNTQLLGRAGMVMGVDDYGWTMMVPDW